MPQSVGAAAVTAPRPKDQHGNQGDADDQRAEGVHQVAKGETLPLPIVFRHLPIVRVAKSDADRHLRWLGTSAELSASQRCDRDNPWTGVGHLCRVCGPRLVGWVRERNVG